MTRPVMYFPLGMILQEMLAGSSPGGRRTGAGRVEELPDALAAIIRKAASPNPRERFPNAFAFRKALQLITTIARQVPTEYHSALPESPRAKEPKRRRTAARVEIPLLLLVVAAGAGFVLGMKTPEGF